MISLRLITVGVCVTLTVACTAGNPTDETPSIRSAGAGNGPLVGKPTLTIGVRVDLPGVGEIVDGNPENRRGFDIDVATYVANGLDAQHIEWHDVSTEDREKAIQSGEVDLVVAAYSITENRMEKVSFAGPYRITGLDIVVRTSDADVITGLSSLKDKRVCATMNGTAPERLIQEFGKAWDVPRHMVRLESTRQCINELLAGKVDAVSCDNMTLLGYVSEQPDRLHLVGRPFTIDNIGIGLAKDDTQDVIRINEILQNMIDDGTWAASIKKHFGPFADVLMANPSTPGQMAASWAIPQN